MNGTRLPVTQLDLIKNFLLMEAAKEGSEQEIYEELESKILGWQWYLRILVSMHEGKVISESRVYKSFRVFYREGPAKGKPVDQFLVALESWIAKYKDVLNVFADLNGNWKMCHHALGRYAPLLMKIAIVFSYPEAKSRRDKLVAQMVKHLRAWIAAERLWIPKHHKQRADEDTSNECLRESGSGYTEEALDSTIHRVFCDITEKRSDDSIRNWVESKGRQQGWTRNAEIIGILEICEKSPGVTPDDVVQAFHQTFEDNKKKLGSCSLE